MAHYVEHLVVITRPSDLSFINKELWGLSRSSHEGNHRRIDPTKLRPQYNNTTALQALAQVNERRD